MVTWGPTLLCCKLWRFESYIQDELDMPRFIYNSFTKDLVELYVFQKCSSV